MKQIQSLENGLGMLGLAPAHLLNFQKPKMRPLITVFTSPTSVQSVSRRKNLNFIDFLDSTLTNSGSWGPISVHPHGKSAEGWQSFDLAGTGIGQILYLDTGWTYPGHCMDRCWILCPCPGNHRQQVPISAVCCGFKHMLSLVPASVPIYGHAAPN